MNNKEIKNDLFDFFILQIINEDKYGSVSKVRSMKNNQIYSIKKYDFSKAKKNNFLKNIAKWSSFPITISSWKCM